MLPGQYYSLTGWLKRVGDVEEAHFGVKFLDSNGALLAGSFKNERVKSPTYRQMQVTGQVPPGAATLALYVWKEDAGSFVLLDDLRLRVGDALRSRPPVPR